MISHLSIGVSDLARSILFYDAVLQCLGSARVFTGDESVGYGPRPDVEGLALKQRPREAIGLDQGFHLAFDAHDEDAVDQFHAAALAHGGTDDGAPGLRPDYGDHYYAAFVIDPDGHRLEAVYQRG
ncbi:VOC family protein [Sphingomonas sp.]|uniref:VOC family protein n=1 Tax=Sphingomonas sp. TaxID=28214 RepID=UPI003D6CD1C4